MILRQLVLKSSFLVSCFVKASRRFFICIVSLRNNIQKLQAAAHTVGFREALAFFVQAFFVKVLFHAYNLQLSLASLELLG